MPGSPRRTLRCVQSIRRSSFAILRRTDEPRYTLLVQLISILETALSLSLSPISHPLSLSNRLPFPPLSLHVASFSPLSIFLAVSSSFGLQARSRRASVRASPVRRADASYGRRRPLSRSLEPRCISHITNWKSLVRSTVYRDIPAIRRAFTARAADRVGGSWWDKLRRKESALPREDAIRCSITAQHAFHTCSLTR